MIDEINYKIYMKFYNEYKNDFKLNGLLYIHAEEDVCYNRVHKRNRNGEDIVALDYLKKCKEYHQEWLVNKKNILVINANYDVDYNSENPDDKGIFWIRLIKNYIDKIMDDEGNCQYYEYSEEETDEHEEETTVEDFGMNYYLLKSIKSFIWKF